jgi:GH24 family phage-related lysozyme (muramidase)
MQMITCEFQPSPKLIKLLFVEESFRSKPYKDGAGLWTIGVGQRITLVQANEWKDGITLDQGRALLNAYLDALCKQLSKLTWCFELTQAQKDAVISIAYNLGFVQFSCSSLYRWLAVADPRFFAEWLVYEHDAKGNIEPGLTTRRFNERQLFVFGIYSS